MGFLLPSFFLFIISGKHRTIKLFIYSCTTNRSFVRFRNDSGYGYNFCWMCDRDRERIEWMFSSHETKSDSILSVISHFPPLTLITFPFEFKTKTSLLEVISAVFPFPSASHMSSRQPPYRHPFNVMILHVLSSTVWLGTGDFVIAERSVYSFSAINIVNVRSCSSYNVQLFINKSMFYSKWTVLWGWTAVVVRFRFRLRYT